MQKRSVAISTDNWLPWAGPLLVPLPSRKLHDDCGDVWLLHSQHQLHPRPFLLASSILGATQAAIQKFTIVDSTKPIDSRDRPYYCVLMSSILSINSHSETDLEPSNVLFPLYVIYGSPTSAHVQRLSHSPSHILMLSQMSVEHRFRPDTGRGSKLNN